MWVPEIQKTASVPASLASMGDLTLDPKRVAEAVAFIYNMPQEVNVREIDIAVTRQNS